MRAMKDSGIEWIGKIPEEWKISKIGYLFKTIGSGTTPSSSDGIYYDGEYNWLQTGDLNDGLIYSTEKTITELAVKKHSVLRQYSIGSLVVAMYGATIGKLGLLRLPCYTNQACCVLSEPNNVNVQLVYYWFLCNRQNLIAYSNGGGQPNINQDIIKRFSICLPPMKEQNSIALYLTDKCSKIDALIAAKEKTNALLKERRQSIIYEAVTKGLDPTAPMKDSGVEWIGEIPQSWNIWRMKHLASEPLQYGANATGVEFSPELPRYVRITDITPERKLNAEGKQSLPENIACDYMLEHGDILFARSGATSGKSFYYEESLGRCCFAGYLIKFQPDAKKVIGKFLYYYTLTQAYEQWTQQIFIQATIQNISAEKYNNLVFAIPPTLDMQDQIVAFLDVECGKLDKIIADNDSTILKLKEYRQSLIYEAVTGKIEV